mmetsp:Transcript_19961/g.30616  ORF Transcript_19961/g.30616 Transcript_19961/m.30616 type:complete len:202 (+) Transcript_19961:728-1333(+)
MGFYKALCSSLDDPETSKQQDTILKGVVAVTNLCGQSGLILSHFCRACDIMLQKKPNNFDISKMRIIKICEADANFLHSAMSIITAIEIVRQAQTGFVLVETDCKAAFDCCIPEIVKMSWLAKWVPPKTAKFVYNHQTQTTYDVTAGGLVSTRTYGGQDTSFGNGQGGSISAESWIAFQDIFNRALEKSPVHACIIQKPCD